MAAGSTRPQEGHQNCPSSRALSINLPTLAGGNGDIDGYNTINLCSRHNKSCSPVVLRFQPAFPPSPAGLYASAGAEDARKRESSQARSRQNCLKSWANKEGRKKTLQFKIRCLVDSTHFHSLILSLLFDCPTGRGIELDTAPPVAAVERHVHKALRVD